QLKEYPIKYLLALGNHDTYSKLEKNQIHIHHLYKELALQDSHYLYYDTFINGIHFYILNSEKPSKSNAYYSKQQLSWLEHGLQKDALDKPVFVLCHHPFLHTHPNTSNIDLTMGIQERDIKAILKKHDHVFFFSGHVHNGINLCNVLYENHITFINVPAFHKVQYGIKHVGLGYQIQIYHDFIYLRTRDYLHGDWLLANEYVLPLHTHQILHFVSDLVLAEQ
ncbi:MAG: metallophosphoesterase, partial [Longicatena sp.]